MLVDRLNIMDGHHGIGEGGIMVCIEKLYPTLLKYQA
jgi:hypothetical protein